MFQRLSFQLFGAQPTQICEPTLNIVMEGAINRENFTAPVIEAGGAGCVILYCSDSPSKMLQLFQDLP